MAISLSVSLSESSLTNLDKSNNVSRVTVTVKCHTSYGEYASAKHSGKFTWSDANGSHSYSFSHSIGKNTTTKLCSKEITVKKSSNGTHTLKVYATFNGVGHSCSDSASKGLTPTPKHTLMYDANGGTGAPSGGSYLYGKVVTLSAVEPVREGYTYLGWGTSATSTTTGKTLTMTSNRTAYAVWSVNNYKLTIINPKSVLGQSTITFDYDSDISKYLEAQKLTVPGYTFDKYIDSSTGEPVNFIKMPARDVILTATYTPNNINFKMFYLKEGSGTTLDDCAVETFPQSYNEKNVVEGFNQLPEYRNIDPYEFKYWATNYVNGRTLVYNIEDNVSYLKQFSTSQIMPTVDTSFYAIYALSKSKLVLTEEDAGRVTILDGYDKEDPLTWFSKNGFKFDGASIEGLLTFSITDPLRTGDVVQRVTFSCNDVSYVFYVGNGNHWVTNGVHLFLTEDGLYHIYYQGLNQEGTKYTLQIQDTKKTIVSIEGIFKYEFILVDINKQSNVIDIGGVSEEVVSWNDSDYVPYHNDGSQSKGEFVSDWTINMMADAIVPQSVEDAYVKASAPVPLPIEQGGTSSTDYPNTFTQNTALSIMSKLTSDSVPLNWFNDLKY